MSTRRCPGFGCEAQVPENQLSCAPHWRELPRELRDRIWDTYRKGRGGPDHTAAVLDAIRYLQAEPEDAEA